MKRRQISGKQNSRSLDVATHFDDLPGLLNSTQPNSGNRDSLRRRSFGERPSLFRPRISQTRGIPVDEGCELIGKGSWERPSLLELKGYEERETRRGEVSPRLVFRRRLPTRLTKVLPQLLLLPRAPITRAGSKTASHPKGVDASCSSTVRARSSEGRRRGGSEDGAVGTR